MRHDDESALARGRFFASIDRMVNEVSVPDDSCGGVLPVPEAGSLLNLNDRAHVPEVDEEGEGASSTVELMGDWSWRPENQVKDPGYVFSKAYLERVNDVLELSRAFGVGERRSMGFAMKSVKPRPWLVAAHVPSPGAPPRIVCIR
jgi:hypothetical protein